MASAIIEKVKPLFAGWRAGLARCTGATAVVALINILFFSIATPKLQDFDRKMTGAVSESIDGALFEGSCETAKQISVLTAPTRREIDREHAKYSWMDIGILSYWNLRRISKRRVLAWAILAISSVPIHLLYNSVVYLETSAYQYKVSIVRANATSTISDDFERLETDECISQYARQFVTSRSDLFVVSLSYSDSDFNTSSWVEVHPEDEIKPASAYGWMCRAMPESCDDASLKAQPDDWKISEASFDSLLSHGEPTSIDYCLSKPVEESCRLAMSVPLMAIVLGCNLLKLVGLGLTWMFLDKQPLLNLGDAVASFLDYPDTTTADSHLLYIGPGRSTKWNSTLNPWKAQRRRWAYFISPFIYAITMVSAVAVISATSFLLKEGISQITNEAAPSFAELWDRGFGSIDVECLVVFSSKSPIETSLLSNTPQLIVSIIYTTVNGMWTAMMVGNEWNGYGLHRKGLRTTKPVGRQRNSYWLSLPWKYGLPLIAASTLLHWLISQSIFLVRLITLDGDEVSSITTSPGYSPIAIIFAILCGATIMIATIGLSLIPCKTAVPQIGTCSAVLSAACHPPEGDENAALERVKWGVVFGPLMEEWDGKERCCVTSWRVEPPIEGRLY